MKLPDLKIGVSVSVGMLAQTLLNLMHMGHRSNAPYQEGRYETEIYSTIQQS